MMDRKSRFGEQWLESLNPKQIRERHREVLQFATDRRVLVRRAAVRALASCDGGSALHLRKLLVKERNLIVRLELIEALGDLKDRMSMRGLREIAEQSHEPLERAAAITALSNILPLRGREAFIVLRDAERNARVRVDLSLALIRRKHWAALEDLFGLLRNRSYLVRCAAANALPDAATDGTRKKTVVMLERALHDEHSPAARSSIRSALRALRRD